MSSLPSEINKLIESAYVSRRLHFLPGAYMSGLPSPLKNSVARARLHLRSLTALMLSPLLASVCVVGPSSSLVGPPFLPSSSLESARGYRQGQVARSLPLARCFSLYRRRFTSTAAPSPFVQVETEMPASLRHFLGRSSSSLRSSTSAAARGKEGGRKGGREGGRTSLWAVFFFFLSFFLGAVFFFFRSCSFFCLFSCLRKSNRGGERGERKQRGIVSETQKNKARDG